MRIVDGMTLASAQLQSLALSHGAAYTRVEGEAATIAALRGAEALWIMPSAYTPALRAALDRDGSSVRWLQVASMGYDSVEELGVPAGVTVTNAGDAYAGIAAEHAIALILTALREIPISVRDQANEYWSAPQRSRVASLIGRTVGIFGYGHLGREIAARLAPFGCRIVAIAPDASADSPIVEAYTLDRRHEGFSGCDILVVAAPLTRETRGVIDAAAFRALPSHALVVNIARGPIVDTVALQHALEHDIIGGAALDVTDPEPLPPGDMLWQHERVIITPHVGGFARDIMADRLASVVARNLAAFLNGEPLPTRVEIHRV